MQTVKIKEPIWKLNAVGIDQNIITDQGVFVSITYKQKDGSFKYPHSFYLSKQLADKCETMKIKNTPTLRIIPIDEMEQL